MPTETPALLVESYRLIGAWQDPAQNGNACSAQDIFHDHFFQTRRIIIEMQKILFFLKAETMQAVGIRKPPKRAKLLGLQRVLQFIGHGHVSHGRNYSKPD